MLTNPSPNARIPRAVSRRRRLRCPAPGLLIGVLQRWTFLKNFTAHAGRSNRADDPGRGGERKKRAAEIAAKRPGVQPPDRAPIGLASGSRSYQPASKRTFAPL